MVRKGQWSTTVQGVTRENGYFPHYIYKSQGTWLQVIECF